MKFWSDTGRTGFTLLELLAVFVIIGILASLLFPAIQGIQAKIQRANCTANLRGLHRGASAYMMDHEQWPQTPLEGQQTQAVSRQWVKFLEPYGVTHEAWICPTIQHILENPDYKSEEGFRVDYFATPFDTLPRTPFLLTRTPWFAERGDVHGAGNLMIFANGSVQDMKAVLAEQGQLYTDP